MTLYDYLKKTKNHTEDDGVIRCTLSEESEKGCVVVATLNSNELTVEHLSTCYEVFGDLKRPYFRKAFVKLLDELDAARVNYKLI